MASIIDVLDAHDVPNPDTVGDRDVQSPAGEWPWAESTCGYVATMIRGWANDDPVARHPWAMSQGVRLAAAHRLGCVTESDYAAAVAALTQRMRVLCAREGSPRPFTDTEITGPTGAMAWGVNRVEYQTDAECSAELGNHDHPDRDNDRVWDERPILRWCRDFARHRRVSPDAVLGHMLARVRADLDPHVVLPPLVGSYGSLNLAVCCVGPSGVGKTAPEAAVREAHPVAWLSKEVGLGSGEGLVDVFAQLIKDPDNPGKRVIKWHTHCVFATVDEVDTLSALGSRQGSTMTSTLRSAISGVGLGFAYRDQDKRVRLPAHSYSLALVVAAQPLRMAWMFEDTEGGLPQRFVWFRTDDPGAPDDPGPDPGPPPIDNIPANLFAAEHPRQVIAVADEVRAEVDGARLAALRGHSSDHPLDSHLALTRLKIAALLGIIDGRIEVSSDDWRVAGLIIDRSQAVVARVQQDLAAESRRKNQRRGESEGHRAVVAEQVAVEAAEHRVARRVASHVRQHRPDGGCTRKCLREMLGSRDKPHLADAIGHAAEAEWIEVGARPQTQGKREVIDTYRPGRVTP